MFKNILIAAASSMIALSAFAADTSQVEKSIELKDGSTLHIFKDGKMGMENRFGRTVSMKLGQVMETKDGKLIDMNGNEIARTDQVTQKNYVDPQVQKGH